MTPIPVIMAALAEAGNVAAVNAGPAPERAFTAFREFLVESAPPDRGASPDEVIVAAALAFALFPDNAGFFTGAEPEDGLILSHLALRLSALARLAPDLPIDLVNPFAPEGAAMALPWTVRAALVADVAAEGGWPPRFEREGFIDIARSLRLSSAPGAGWAST